MPPVSTLTCPLFQNKPVDLVVSGPNEGSNLGPLGRRLVPSPFSPCLISSSCPACRAVFTLSGTLGAAYVAVGRGIPAVAFSAGNSTKRSYKDWDPKDPEDIGERWSSSFCFFVWWLADGVCE